MESDTSFIESFLIHSTKRGGNKRRLNFESVESVGFMDQKSYTDRPNISQAVRSRLNGQAMLKNVRNRLNKRAVSYGSHSTRIYDGDWSREHKTRPMTTFSKDMRNKKPRFMMETTASKQAKKIRLYKRFNV
jgi:hypothetical protein